jgi:peptidyl-prolyl cis-trans isomerase SurA
MVSAFEDAAFSLPPGAVSEPVKTEFGYHIIRVDDVDGERVRARHILISLRPEDADKEAARGRAEEVYQQILAGADFAEMARQRSAHGPTAEVGGRLGLYPVTNLPPAFAGAVQGMRLGEVSGPVATEFGWHLVKVNDEREVLEDIIRQTRLRERFDEVLANTRDKLYVEIRSSEP